jgi:NDP-sugar pyrophosphorylase family protein
MILAAGLGTRLRPLTDDRPKALVEVAGHTLLEIALRRLISFEIREVIVNAHHFADMVVDFLKRNDNFGIRVEVSREDILLDTGGGLKKAAWFLQGEQPFILHNVDVLSTIDLERMVQFHDGNQALCTLAVQNRKSSRNLMFDDAGKLCGRRVGNSADELVRASASLHARAFSGVHVISPRLLPLITEEGVFSIITSYVRLAGAGENIVAFPADEYYWRDLGKPEDLAEAARDLKQGLVSL